MHRLQYVDSCATFTLAFFKNIQCLFFSHLVIEDMSMALLTSQSFLLPCCVNIKISMKSLQISVQRSRAIAIVINSYQFKDAWKCTCPCTTWGCTATRYLLSSSYYTHTEIFIFKYRFTAIVAVAILFVQTAEQKMWLNLKIIRLMLKIELIVRLFLKSLISLTQRQRDLTWIEHRCSHTVLLTVCLCHIVLHTNCTTCCGAEAWGK